MDALIQGSAEWFAARCGKVTASRVADVIAETKSGWGASRANYAAELIAERLTGVSAPGFSNAAMMWGTDTEPQARAAYVFRTDCEVEEIGFVDHPRIAMTGASPDGLIGVDGMIEIKCPNTATHLDTLLSETVPSRYITQMQWQMACADRAWCDFASYDPRLPASMSLFVKRIPRDDALIGDMESKVIAFLAEIDAKVARLTERYAVAA